MPSIDVLRKTEKFRAAYGRLDQGKRLAVDHGLIRASMALNTFVQRLKPVLWDLQPDDAGALDTAVRTQLALGVFRATFANTYTRDSRPMTEAIDDFAKQLDVRAAALVLGRCAREIPSLKEVDPAQAAAFHQVLDQLTRSRGMAIMRIASIATDAAIATDVAIEALYNDATRLDEQLLSIRQGASEAIQKHADHKGIPLIEAGALWVLAMRGRCSMFGEEERTQAYADFDESSYF